jgi:hypothetical protein
MNKQTAVEWLAEKYNYVTWMRNRDEISAGLADIWREHYLDKAKRMERDQIENAFEEGMFHHLNGYTPIEFYEETFKEKEK